MNTITTERYAPIHSTPVLQPGCDISATMLLEDIENAIDDVLWAASFYPLKCLYANKACEKVFGYTAEEMIADADLFPDCILPEDRDQFFESVRLALETGSCNCIFRIKNKKGEIKVLKGQGILKQPVIPGNPPILTGVVSDITTLLDMRNQLKEKAVEVETILESISDAFFTISQDGIITYANNSMAGMMGCRREDIVGRIAWELFPASRDTIFYNSFSECLQKKTVVRFEDYYEPLDRWFNVNVYPTAKGLSVYCTDITDEQKAKKKLLDIAILQSHQVRGPVATILGLAQLIDITTGPQDPHNADIIRGLVASAKKLDELVKEIDDKTTNG